MRGYISIPGFHSRRYSVRLSAHAVVSVLPKWPTSQPCAIATHRKELHRRQLSAHELKSIQPGLTSVQLRANTVLHELGSSLGKIDFPLELYDTRCLPATESGEQIETGIVGAEGLLGGDAPVNGHLFGQATVQLDGAALTVPKAQFVDAYHAHPHLQNLVNRYQILTLSDASAAKSRLSRAPFSPKSSLPLDASNPGNMVGSATFNLTQEFLWHWPGVCDGTPSPWMPNTVPQAGLIRLTRGNITVLNRDGLEDCACECYSGPPAETEEARERLSKRHPSRRAYTSPSVIDIDHQSFLFRGRPGLKF